MNLYDEDILVSKKKSGGKGSKILLIIIILLVLLCIGIVAVIIVLQDEIINVSMDGKANEDIKKFLIFEENDTKLYVPVRKMASILGYTAYNGEYLNISEDKTKCHVKSENEVVNIYLNSNQIIKKDLTIDSNYEKIQIDEPIKEINNELCTTIDGIKKIFNVEFTYDVSKKNISVYTLDYLVKSYNSILSKYGYTEIKEDFSNKKNILNNILVVKNESNKYGVITSDGTTILEPKYDDIVYLKATNDFMVTSNEKIGVISYEKQIKIKIEYDKIEEINDQLYCVTKDDYVGVITKNGKNVIYPKYDYIGIEKNNIFNNESKYVFLEDLIPVKDDNKWAIFNIDGNNLTDFEFDDLGCIISNDKEKNSVLFIENYNVFVAMQDKKYYLVKKDGTNVVDAGFESVYKVNNEGKTEYYLTYNNGQVANVIELLEKLGINKIEE